MKAQFPDSKQKKGSQGILRNKSALSREIAGRMSWKEQKHSGAPGKGSRASKSLLLSWQQIHQSNSNGKLPGSRVRSEAGQQFRHFGDLERLRYDFPVPKPKLVGTGETAYTPWGDQYSGSDWEQVILGLVKTTFSCDRQLADRGFFMFLRKIIVTWSATARANLSILDPASAIFLAALMTSDVFFRGPLPLWNTI